MSETPKFTPGPWELVVELPTQYGDHVDAGGFRIDADGVEQLAYVWNPNKRINPDSLKQEDGEPFGDPNARANAHLIAAAPELWQALKAASHALRSYQHGNTAPDLAAQVADFADAALAKAEGRK